MYFTTLSSKRVVLHSCIVNHNSIKVFKFQAFDSDEGENGLVLYKMKSGNTSLFKVTTTGSLMLINGLDIDNGSNMKYEVKIEANNSKPYASGSQLTNGVQTITVVIKVNMYT